MTRILIVDDHAANREYLVALLNHDYTTLEAIDGTDALEQVRRHRPDLVIADILMPTMDGYEFVRRLREDATIADTRVIFLTAVYHEHETRELAESSGVSCVLTKPCEPETVLQTVEWALDSVSTAIQPPNREAFDRKHLRVVTDKLSQTINDLGIANERFGALISINLKLASERDPRKLLRELCTAARDLIGARHAVLAVGTRGSTKVRYCATAGMEAETAEEIGLETLDSGEVGASYRDQRTQRLLNRGGDPVALGLPPGHPPAESALVAPIVSLKHIYGWICLTGRIGSHEFTADDERLLTILAAQVGRIYENGDLYLEVQESERKFRQLTEHIHEVFFLVDPEMRRTLYVSPAYEEIWGRRTEDLYDDPSEWMKAVHPGDRKLALAAFASGRDTGHFDYEFRILRLGGEERWIHARGFPIHDSGNRLYRIAGIAEDITNRKSAEERIQRLSRVHAVMSGINSSIVRLREREALFKETCRILVEHGRFAMAWVGLLDQETLAVTVTAYQGPAADRELLSGIQFSASEHLPGGRTTVGEALRHRRPAFTTVLTRDDEPAPDMKGPARRGYRRIISLPLLSGDTSLGVVVLYSKEPGELEDEEMALLVELAEDISYALDYIKNEELIEYLAYHDPLTGLVNRATLHRRLTDVIAGKQTENGTFALLLMNINNFRDINDTLGHSNGDVLLRETAGRLSGVLWDSDVVACLGGDEFAILLPSLADKGDIQQVIGKISRVLQRQFMIGGLPVNVEARLGVALYPDHGDTADVLWQRADIALRSAKELHGSWALYEPAIDHYDADRLTLIGGLRSAMDHNELVLHYQPNIDLSTGRVHGVEALLRWQHPERGLIFPDEFIPQVERTGLVNTMTSWVLANALRQGRVWHANGLLVEVSINISVRNLLDPDLCGDIVDMARSSRFPLERLKLEITESALMTDPELARSVLQELSDAGIRLSVDDFGTGHSSLVYVRDLPVSTIKIDKSFVIDFDQPRNAAIVSTAVDLGHNLGMTVTAEGVESEATWVALREMGCDTAQGYYFSRPLPIDQATAWLRESPWRYVPG